MYTIGRGIYVSKGTMCFVFRKGDKYKTFRGPYDYYTVTPVDNDTLVNMYLLNIPDGCPFSRMLSIKTNTGVYDGKVLELMSLAKKSAEPIWTEVDDIQGEILLNTLISKKFIVSLY